jgi:hypothetical protein
MMRSQVDPEDTNATKKEPRRALRWEHTYSKTSSCNTVFPLSTQNGFPRGSHRTDNTRMLSPSPSSSLGSQSRGQITVGSPRLIHGPSQPTPNGEEKKISVSLWSGLQSLGIRSLWNRSGWS